MSTSVNSSLFSSSEIKAIVTQLEARIAAPIAVEKAEITTDTAEISALGKVKASLSTLNNSLSGIADPASINALTATVSNENASAKTATSAAIGSYSLTNVKLARAQEIYSGSYASGAAKLGTGGGSLTFKFTGGTSVSVAVPAGSATVAGVAKAINAAGKGVDASVVNTANGVKLVLTSASTGSAQSFSVTGTGSLANLSYGTGTNTLTLAQAARNTSLSVNGVPVTEAGNSSLQIVQGLTVSLKASGSATVSVSQSTASLAGSLSSFANSLNSAVNTIATETSFKAGSSGKASASKSAGGSKQAGPLLGSVQVQQLKQDLLGAISSAATSGVAAASLGFSISSAGKVSFDQSKLEAAYTRNPAAVNKLVQQIETKVKGIVTTAIGSGTAGKASTTGSASATAGSGFIAGRSLDLKDTIDSLTTEIGQQTTLGNEQVTNLESEFSAAIAATSSSGVALSYLSVLDASAKSTNGG